MNYNKKVNRNPETIQGAVTKRDFNTNIIAELCKKMLINNKKNHKLHQANDHNIKINRIVHLFLE
jgi:hypothetical protein